MPLTPLLLKVCRMIAPSCRLSMHCIYTPAENIFYSHYSAIFVFLPGCVHFLSNLRLCKTDKQTGYGVIMFHFPVFFAKIIISNEFETLPKNLTGSTILLIQMYLPIKFTLTEIIFTHVGNGFN